MPERPSLAVAERRVLLIDADPVNVDRVRCALQILEDKAVSEVGDDDIARYAVVRVADEIVVDLMGKACGVDYADASRDAVVSSSVAFPFRSQARGR